MAAVDNTGASPYIDSKHAYKVNIDKKLNIKEWIVTNKLAGAAEYTKTITILNQDDPEFDWFTIYPAEDGEDEIVEIYFDRDIFGVEPIPDPNRWYLQYKEYDGTHTCISAREFTINVVENTFRLTLPDAVLTQCSDEEGEVHKYSDIDEPTEVFSTRVTYTVTMTKDPDFDPTSWIFNATFDQDVISILATSNDGDVEITGLTPRKDFSLEVTPVAFSSPVDVSITVEFKNYLLANVTHTLTVSSGQGIVTVIPNPTGIPDAITDDNEYIYPVDPLTQGDRTQDRTILALPATRDIVAGAGESGGSELSPLLLSSHKYEVQMQHGGNTGTWYIEDANEDPLEEGLGKDYTLSVVRSGAVADATETATIEFINQFLDISNPNFVIYFKEVDVIGTTGCSTVRPYPITIYPPFDVLVTAGGDQCAKSSIDGTIYTDLTSDVTTISYVVAIQNATAYPYAWYFDLAVTTAYAGGFDPLDVDVADGGISILANGGYVEGANKSVGTVSVDAGTTEVTINVTYEGYYVNEHNLIFTLTNVRGHFNDKDKDAVNRDSNILYRLPQPEAIAGVD